MSREYEEPYSSINSMAAVSSSSPENYETSTEYSSSREVDIADMGYSSVSGTIVLERISYIRNSYSSD